MQVKAKPNRHKPAPQDVQYVYHPSFSLPGAQERLWGRDRQDVPVRDYTLWPQIGEPAGTCVHDATRLSRQQEKILFLRYNYAKYRLSKLSCGGDSSAATRAAEAKKWRTRARRVREKLVHANLALVPGLAKRVRAPGVEFADLLSEGYMAVLRSIDKFDVSRGFKFSTYAYRSILAALRRAVSKARRHQERFGLLFEPELDGTGVAEHRESRRREVAIDAVRKVLRGNLAGLNDTQHRVIRERFGARDRKGLRPLSEVGRRVGLSDERVRQIEKASLEKLREALEDHLAA